MDRFESKLKKESQLAGHHLQDHKRRINFDQGNSFNDLGEKNIIEKDDIDDIKQVSIPAEVFESMEGFQENAKVQFIVQLWDRAGNSIIGPVSDSLMTIDQIIPDLVKLEITSSNELDSKRAMEGDEDYPAQ